MGGISNENQNVVIRPQNIQGSVHLGGGKLCSTGMVQNRRALSTINQNIIIVGPNKRTALTKINGPSSEIPPIPSDRPITRKFAQQLASKQKQPQLPKEIKKSEDLIILDVDDDEYKCAGDSPVPMFVQHTEAMLDEIDQMEIEMEEASAEKVKDIDIGDQNDHLAVVEYVDDLYSYYKKVEGLSCISSDYMSQQSDVNDRMRAILVDWLIEVHYKFELMEETLYLTVNLIDRFLAVEQVVRKKLQLVGVTAMLLACKYEELQVPIVDDFIVISDKAYCRQDILDMEKLMLTKLKFNMSIPTPYVFMRRFLKAAESDKKMELLSFYIIELSLVEYEMIKFPPSLLAAAAVFTAQCALNGYQLWTRTSQKYASYSTSDLRECSKMMASIHQKAPTGRLNGVYRKYSTSKYGYAAKIEPAYFLLQDNSCKIDRY